MRHWREVDYRMRSTDNHTDAYDLNEDITHRVAHAHTLPTNHRQQQTPGSCLIQTHVRVVARRREISILVRDSDCTDQTWR